MIIVYCCKYNKYIKDKHHRQEFKCKKMNRLPDFLCFCFPRCIVSKDYVERDMKRDHTSETTKLHLVHTSTYTTWKNNLKIQFENDVT